MKRLRVILFLLIAMMVFSSVQAERIIIYTEESPPFNFTESGKLTGVSTEVVKAVMRSVEGLKYEIKSLPWAESYRLAQEKPNALVYSTSRPKDREKLFKWIGVIAPTSDSVYSLKSRSDIKINNLNDMKKYNIGTTAGDIMESWLIGKGFSMGDFIRSKGDNPLMKNFKKLVHGQIDLWPYSDAAVYHIARQEGHTNPDLLIRNAFALDELTAGLYLAASLKTSDALVERLTNALKKYKRTDAYYKTLAHWGVDAMGLETTAPIAKLTYALKNFKYVAKVGYLATDKLSAHREGGLYRKEMREKFVEAYAKTFDEWREKFIKIQDQVDILLIGEFEGIKGWNASQAKQIVLEHTKIPTGCVVKGMADYSLINYEDDEMVLNKLVANQLGLSFPNSYIRKAARVIE